MNACTKDIKYRKVKYCHGMAVTNRSFVEKRWKKEETN